MTDNYRFYREMLTFLTDNSAYEKYFRDNDPDKPYYRLPYDVFENDSERSFQDTMSDIIDRLQATPFLDKQHLSQYHIAERLSEQYSISIQEMFCFLFALSELEIMRWKAYGILYDYYGNILNESLLAFLLEKSDHPQRIAQLEDYVMETLSDYVLRMLVPDDIDIIDTNDDSSVYSIDYCIDSYDESEEYNYLEEYIRQCCFVLTNNDITLLKSMPENAPCVISVPDRFREHEVLANDFLTFVENSNREEAVTYQIIDFHKRVKLDRENQNDAEDDAQASTGKCPFLVRRLPYPILNAEDIDLYK